MINTGVLKQPMNWFTVGIMVFILVIAISQLHKWETTP